MQQKQHLGNREEEGNPPQRESVEQMSREFSFPFLTSLQPLGPSFASQVKSAPHNHSKGKTRSRRAPGCEVSAAPAELPWPQGC